MNYLFQFDTNLFLFLNHLPHNFFLDNFFWALSFLGEYGAIWFLLSFLLFLNNLRILASQGTALRSYFFIEAKKLAVIWGTGIASLTLVFFLKEIFKRSRPELVLLNVILPFGPDHSFSFPSGHALVSFTFATILTNSTQRLPRRSRLLAMTGFYSLAILISFSRIFLGYHYPLDIVSGAIIGIIVAKVVIKIIKNPMNNKKPISNTNVANNQDAN